MSDFLQECGVSYYSHEQGDPGSPFKEFRYERVHVETAHKSTWNVWCFNSKDFLKLLQSWNRDKRWHYIPMKQP